MFLLLGLADFSFLLNALLVQCRKLVSRSCFEKLLFIRVPVRKMVLLIKLIVSVVLLPLPHFSRNWVGFIVF